MGEPLELPMPLGPSDPKPGAAFHRGNSKQNYATPADLMAAVEHRFGPMDFDLAAEPSNAKAPKFYTKEDDAFSKDWKQLKGNLWLNPEYDDIAPWAERCASACCVRWERRIFFLVPASVGSDWFAQYVHERALVLALNGRVSFDGIDPYPKDLILACYGLGYEFDVWRWPDELQTKMFERSPCR